MLARGELQTIGATTLDEYRKHIEKDPALERRFQPIQVAEPTLAHTIEILKGLRDRYEAHHRVSITDARARRGGQPGRPLHQRPLPAGQGDRPHRRGGRAAAHPPDDRAAGPARVRRADRARRAARRSRRSTAQDFEKAARAARRREAACASEKAEREQQWKSGDMDVVAEVDEELIAEVLAACDRHPGVQADRGGVQPPAPHGGRAAQADRRHGRRHQGAVPGDPAHPRRPEGPASSRWLVHLRRPHRCR